VAVTAQCVSTTSVLRGEAPKTFDWAGYGSGYGSGYGYGDGDGYGDGSGSGDGDGYGYGDGDGYGDGYGYGYGSKEYWLATIDGFAAKWPDTLRSRLSALREQGATIAFWRSDAKGQPANNGGKIEAAQPGVVHTAPGPLHVCRRGTLHATLVPPKWNGERWWIVAMKGEVRWDDDKCGALEREIIGECL
jgi:hypothetical protein